MVMIPSAYHRPARPLARGRGGTSQQLEPLHNEHDPLSEVIALSPVGDRGFNHTLPLENLGFWGLDIARRHPGHFLVMRYGTTAWHRVDNFDLTPGTMRSLGCCFLTAATDFPTHMILHFYRSKKELRFLTHEVDCTVSRELSVFHIGWDFVKRCLALDDPMHIIIGPRFSKDLGRLSQHTLIVPATHICMKGT